MKKEVLFIHSAGPQGHHEGSDFLVTHLRKALGEEYEIHFPKMPDPENPHYKLWSKKLKKELSSMTGEKILVGHSLGGSILLKYLSEEEPTKKVAGLFVVAAPFWGKEDWDVEEYKLQENFSSHLEGVEKVYLYHSKDDEVVPVAHLAYYTKELPYSTPRQVTNRGHLFGKGLPELVEDIKRL